MLALLLILFVAIGVSVVIVLAIFSARRNAAVRARGHVYPQQPPYQGGVYGMQRGADGSSPLDAFFPQATYGNDGYAHPRHENGHPHHHHSHQQDFQVGGQPMGHGSYHAYPDTTGHGSHQGHSHSDGSSSSWSDGSSSFGSDSGSSSSSD